MSRDETARSRVLYDVWEEEPSRPPPPEKPSNARGQGRQARSKEKHDREEIFEALREARPRAVLPGARRARPDACIALARLRRRPRLQPDRVVRRRRHEGHERRRVPRAAGHAATPAPGPHGLYLAQDKALAKKIFAFHGIHTPYFATVLPRAQLEHSHDIAVPGDREARVARTARSASTSAPVVGVDQGADGADRLHPRRVRLPGADRGVHRGPRDLRRACSATRTPRRCRWSSSTSRKLPEGTPKIAGTEVKWEKDTEAYRVTKSAPAEDLDEETADAALTRPRSPPTRRSSCATTAASTCGSTPKGEVYVIEANPNPWLSSGAEFAMAARKAGRTYTPADRRDRRSREGAVHGRVGPTRLAVRGGPLRRSGYPRIECAAEDS